MLSAGIVASVDVPAAPVGTPSGDLLAYLTPFNFINPVTVLVEGGNYEVDWGDGIYLQYPGGFTAIVVPTGPITVKSSNSPYYVRFLAVTEINVVKSSSLTDLTASFSGTPHFLESFAIDDTSNVTTFQDAWAEQDNLTSFPVIDLSSATSVRNAWKNCDGLTSFPLLDFSQVSNFSEAWSGCSGLTSFPVIDISSATAINHTWQRCSSLTSFPELAIPLTVTSLLFTWHACSSLTSFPSLRDTSNITDWRSTFRDCTSLVCITDADTTAIGADKLYMFLNTPALVNPNIFAQADLQSPTGAVYTNPGTCP